MSEPRPSPARRLLGPALLLLGLLLGYHLTRPATVNGDGVGYLRQAMGQGLAPGHLAYLPLLRGLARLAPVSTPIELEPRARWLSLLAALLGLALFWDGARRLGSARTALFATGLLGISHAFARAAQEVEVYAVAALLALTCLWALLRLLGASARTAPFWVLLAGASCGLAILFHLTLALLAPSLLLLLWRLAPLHRARAVLLGGAALALVAGLPLLLALQLENRLHPAAAWAWLRSADHGLPYPHTLFTPLVALWGLCRSLVHAPYPYEASLLRVALLSGTGVLAWLGLLQGSWRRRQQAPLPGPVRWLIWAWLAPLALFGLLFYPSDTERWIFVLPPLALWLARGCSRRGVLLLGGVALLNLISIQIPQALDDRAPRQAAAVDAITGASDLVVSPGHGWDELIGLAESQPPARFPLVYFVGAGSSLPRALQQLQEAMQASWRSGGRVFVARLEDTTDPRGFKELTRLGLSRAGWTALFATHQPRTTRVPGLWELQPPGRPSR